MSTACRREQNEENSCEYEKNQLHCHTGYKSWPVAVSRLSSSSSAGPLVGWGLWCPWDLEGWNAGNSVVETFLNSTAVNHILDSGNGQRRLSHVGSYHTQTGTRRRGPEYLWARNTHKSYFIAVFLHHMAEQKFSYHFDLKPIKMGFITSGNQAWSGSNSTPPPICVCALWLHLILLNKWLPLLWMQLLIMQEDHLFLQDV